MKKGTTVGFMAVFAGVLLATMTSVYAFHAAQGKGNVSVAPKVSSQFQFVVARQLEGSVLQPGLNFVQFEMTRVGGPMSFQTFMISTAIAFSIPPESDDEPDVRTVTIIGEMFSTTFPGVGPKRQPVSEFVHFTAVGMDKRTPDAGPDSFSLTVEYSANQAQGPLFESLGVGTCVHESDPPRITCTFKGPVEMGNGKVNVHTTGGD
jgi:hypothetical protein